MRDPLKNYPHKPGWKDEVTSKPIAEAKAADGTHYRHEDAVLRLYKAGFEGSADQAADALGIHFISIRPVCTGLIAQGELYKTGRKTMGPFGRPQMILSRSNPNE